MKIRDKRSAYFRLHDTQIPYPKLRFVYLDEIDANSAIFDSTVGEELNNSGVKKIDADRPFILFTGNAYDAAPALTYTSSVGVAYSGNSVTGGDGTAATIIPGFRCGDFVSITTK